MTFRRHLRKAGAPAKADKLTYGNFRCDENPLALPFLKCKCDRAADPQGTPDRLKISLVNLNLRMSESETLRYVGSLPGIRETKVVERAVSVVDRLLDSKTATNIRIITGDANVEVLAVKLNLGRLSFIGPRNFARAIRSGSTSESWDMTFHRSG